MNAFTLLGELKVDTGKAVAGLKDVDRQLDHTRKELEKTEGSAAELGGGMARNAQVVTAGAKAIAAGATAAAAAMAYLLHEASEFGSKIHDVSIQTGLSAETVAALGFNAKNAGADIGAVSTSITRFNKTVGEAANGSAEAAKKLELLGINPVAAMGNLEGSVDSVFQKINEAGSIAEKTALAVAAFGRGGADLIPTIDQMGGSLSGATAEAKRLGLTLTGEQVAAADNFGDALGILGSQAKVAGAAFALEFAPKLTEAIEAVSKTLAEGQAVWADWGDYASNTLSGVEAALTAFLGKAEDGQRTMEALGVAVKVAVGILSGGLIPALEMAGSLFDRFRFSDGALGDSGDAAFVKKWQDAQDKFRRGFKGTTPDAPDAVNPQQSETELWRSRVRAEMTANNIRIEDANRTQRAIIDAEKAAGAERKRLIDAAIRQAKEYAEATVKAQKAAFDAFAQGSSNRVTAFNYRDSARQFSAGRLDENTDANLQRRLRGQLSALSGVKASGYGEIDAVLAARNTSGLSPELRSVLDKGIIDLFRGVDPSKLPSDLRSVAAGAFNREAGQLEKESDLKQLLKAINDLKGGHIVQIVNDAPNNARVTTNANAGTTAARY